MASLRADRGAGGLCDFLTIERYSLFMAPLPPQAVPLPRFDGGGLGESGILASPVRDGGGLGERRDDGGAGGLCDFLTIERYGLFIAPLPPQAVPLPRSDGGGLGESGSILASPVRDGGSGTPQA